MMSQAMEAMPGGDDLGPIENHLQALATEWRLPRQAIVTCLIRIGLAAPALRAVLVRAADGEALSDDESRLLFRGLFILGGARDTEAFRPLLRLLRRPEADLDHLFGEGVTEGFSRIITGVFDGDVDALFEIIVDRSVGQYVREELLDAAAFLTWKGVIARDRMRALLEKFDQERLADDDDEAWVGWLKSIALLGFRDMAPLVYRSLEEGRAPAWVIDRKNFDEMLAEAEAQPNDAERFGEFQIGYIDDVIDALEWSDSPEPGEKGKAPFGGGSVWKLAEPVTNPWRHVGRNDPCPCGSGKKAKKCCLANRD
jgi:Protein of unknown function (DUF1186)/SEC-C motif